MEFQDMSQSPIFTVDIFKERYDFVSGNFPIMFAYTPCMDKNKM